MDNYCYYPVYVTNTRAKRNYDTVEFYQQHTKVPGIATIDAATTTSQQLISALSNPKHNTAVGKVGHRKLVMLRVLVQNFQHTAAMNKPGFEAPKHTAQTRVEASSMRLHNPPPPAGTISDT